MRKGQEIRTQRWQDLVWLLLRQSLGYWLFTAFGLGYASAFFTARRRGTHDLVFNSDVLWSRQLDGTDSTAKDRVRIFTLALRNRGSELESGPAMLIWLAVRSAEVAARVAALVGWILFLARRLSGSRGGADSPPPTPTPKAPLPTDPSGAAVPTAAQAAVAVATAAMTATVTIGATTSVAVEPGTTGTDLAKTAPESPVSPSPTAAPPTEPTPSPDLSGTWVGAHLYSGERISFTLEEPEYVETTFEGVDYELFQYVVVVNSGTADECPTLDGGLSQPLPGTASYAGPRTLPGGGFQPDTYEAAGYGTGADFPPLECWPPLTTEIDPDPGIFLTEDEELVWCDPFVGTDQPEAVPGSVLLDVGELEGAGPSGELVPCATYSRGG